MDSGSDVVRLRLGIRGVVQGVGFRPFVHRLAVDLALSGWVCNEREGVSLEVEGRRRFVEAFLDRVVTEAPIHSRIRRVEPVWMAPCGGRGFEIRESDTTGTREGAGFVVPDLATCDDCLREVFDPANRRFRYPFTNCTHCGPRFSILVSLPYDRARTSMRGFRMCARCQAEYDDPADRRFHAQPNACPDCGPSVVFREGANAADARGDEALARVVAWARAGRIVAVQGIGGFHLWVAAHRGEAVSELRRRKRRGAKPFAVMFPSLEAVREICDVSVEEERLLRSSAAPIVLLRRRSRPDPGGEGGFGIAPEVAPGNPYIGAMLPYAPLHHLLLGALGCPVVATSGNRGDEPICYDPEEATERLGALADGFLVHDRPIVRPLDDSVVRVIDGRPVVLRRARGYAPSAIGLEGVLGKREAAAGKVAPTWGVLALGAHMKNAVAVSDGAEVHLGPHLGDLETPAAVDAFRFGAVDLAGLFRIEPSIVAVDAHPDYASSRYGIETGWPTVAVQHHYAHALACMAENGTPPPALGVIWDGTGDGMDGTVWGGEFLRVNATGFERVGWLRPFRLPGGDVAVREPRRSALGVLYAMYGREAFGKAALPSVSSFEPRELVLLETALERGINAPTTTSAGRLFDAVASLCGLRQLSGFEGDAAMAVEFACEGEGRGRTYPVERAIREVRVEGAVRYEWDWGPMLEAMLADLGRGVSSSSVTAGFHDALAEVVLAIASRVGESRVVLSGGCFQNRRLTEGVLGRLRSAGFVPVWHRWVPPNDGGIALGQVVAALRAAG